MKTPVLTLIVGVLPVALFGVSPEISLRSSSDLIINTDLRETALEIGRREIASERPEFLVTIEEVKSPFLPYGFEADAPVDQTPEAPQISYSDEAILEAVASRFSKQVRGTLSRGSVSYLQVAGGSLIRPGATFPASVPQLGEQTFEIRVESITPEAYELVLNEARIRLTFDRAETGSGRIQFTD